MIYKSSKTYVYFYKYGGIIPAILFFIVWLQALILNSDIFSEEPGEIPFYIFTIITFCIIALSVIMWIKIGLILQYVEMDDDKITVYKSKEIVTYNWNQIERIEKIIFTIPVSYKIKIRGKEEYFLFCSTPMLPAPFHIFDMTSLGRFIKIKTHTLNI